MVCFKENLFLSLRNKMFTTVRKHARSFMVSLSLKCLFSLAKLSELRNQRYLIIIRHLGSNFRLLKKQRSPEQCCLGPQPWPLNSLSIFLKGRGFTHRLCWHQWSWEWALHSLWWAWWCQCRSACFHKLDRSSAVSLKRRFGLLQKKRNSSITEGYSCKFISCLETFDLSRFI